MKLNYKLLIICILLLFSGDLLAQENIAANTNATFTASTNNGAFGPNRLNDGQINACGFQECWVTGAGGSTANWILATFNQAEDVTAIKIYMAEKDSRYLSGATIQYWDGSAYVDHHTYLITYNNTNRQDNPCDIVVNFPRINTERIRITNWVLEGAQLSNPNFREIEMYNLRGADAGFNSIIPLFAAGNQNVQGSLKNFSYLDLDSVDVEWSVNGAVQTSSKITTFGSENSLQDTVVDLGMFNFLTNIDYDVKAWTSTPNGIVDSVLTNDTFTFSFKAVGKPAPPTLEDQTYCGVSAPLLKGTSPVDTDLNWYSDAPSTQFIGTSDSIQLTQTISPTDTVQFYGRSMVSLDLNHTLAPMSGTWSYGGNMVDMGTYVNITPKFDMILDSLNVGFSAPNAASQGPYDVDVYWKTGLHNGFETNSAAWTLAATTTDVTFSPTPAASNPIIPAKVDAGKIVLKANTQYALYVMVNDARTGFRTNCIAGTYENNIARYENESFIVDEGALSIGTFSATAFLVGFVPEIHYEYSLVLESDSAIANIRVHPKPTGAEIAGVAGSLGTFNAGTETNPDFTTNGEMIEYEFMPPTGYNNADFGTTWAFTSLTIETASGTPINALDTATTLPSAGGNGTLTIDPRITEVDSLFKITAVLADLGPYFCDSVVERWLYVAPRPEANFTHPVTMCDEDGILFENMSTIESGFMTFQWYFTQTSTGTILDSSDALNPVYVFPTFGDYDIRLITSNAQYGYSDDTTIRITVGEIPTIDAKAQNACEGILVNFINNTTASTATPTFMWDFGDGVGTSTQTSPSYLYAIPGGYQVKLIATAGGCSSEKVINAYQFAKPVSDFTAPTGQICSNQSLSFVNNTTIAQGAAGALWDFSDNNQISTDLNPLYQFSTGGTFDVKLISVSQFGCSDSVTKQVVIDLAPTANFDNDQFCENEPTQFTNTSSNQGSNAGVAWDFGDGSTSSLDNPSHNWSGNGSYTVKLTITSANTCSSEIIKDVEVLAQPIADFTAIAGCSGEPINFENNSNVTKGQLSYNWDLGNGETSTAGSPTATYNVNVSSSFNVSLTAFVDGGCPSTITKPIDIEPSPICGFTFTDTFISGQGRGLYFKAAAQAGANYNWVLGVDGPGPNAAEFFHKFTYDRGYKVKLNIVNGSNCECSLEQTVQSPPTSLLSISDLSVSVYPSPASNELKIEGEGIEKVEVFNSAGKLVYSYSDAAVKKIDISNWAAGVYQVNVQTDKGNAITKIVKI